MTSKIRQNNIKKNYFYNLLYQFVALLTPLLITPHLSRVLKSSGVGQYSFSFSIVTYFVLLANLGFTYYAQREIAKTQNDINEQSKIFFEVVILKIIASIISLSIFYFLLFLGAFGDYYYFLLLILSIEIFAVAFDVSFFFQGNEQFKIIALRNVAIKCASTILIFLFVKTQDDVWVYTLIQALSIITSNLLLWPNLKKCIQKVPLNELHFKKHILPSIRLFIPTIAISVYTILDKTLIGIFIKGSYTDDFGNVVYYSDVENGYYELTEQIVKITLTIITSLGSVMIPRNSQTIADGNIEDFKKNIYNVLRFVFFVGFPISFGLIAISYNFCPWYFDSEVDKIPNLMIIFSPLVLIIGISNVLGLQFLIPLNQDKKYTISITVGAAINLLLNIILIPLLWSYGAAIATVIAELFISCLMAFFAKKIVSIKKILMSGIKSFISALLMFACVFITSRFLYSSIENSILLICEGVVIYLTLQYVLKEKIIIDFFHSLKNKLKK